MGYAKTTPASTQRAVSAYVGQVRFIGIATALLVGTAAAVAIAISFMVIDRYVEWPTAVRIVGPWLAGLALLGGIVVALIALFRKHDPFGVAVRLDTAFPQYQDRWSSSIDLADQVAAGRNAGDKANLDKLFSDTESLTTQGVGSIVPRRPLWLGLAACIVIGGVLLFVRTSPAFDVPLLWNRFLHPTLDLPRDSSTRIIITEINGQPFTGEMPSALPEGSPLALRVELRHKPGPFAFGQADKTVDTNDQLAPRLEQHTANGKRSIEFSRVGPAWLFSQARLDESLEFKIRVDDGLTQTLRADVTPRIKLSTISTAIRFPRYTRMKDQPLAPLQGNRISALSDSVVDFQAAFDRPFKSVTATYEAMKSEKEGQAAAPAKAMQPLGTPEEKDPSQESSRRTLRIQKRDGNLARFTLPLDSGGILRVKAIGDNDLPSEEWVCAVEAVSDSPPRIVVTGLDPVSTIVPGETVSFQYKTEDDLAITDIVMDWSVAGGIHSSELGGDEYLRNPQLGTKSVSGQELIQRMNYKFYATEPFQFFLTAVDSKGQESHTETYKIYIVSDDYATRFDRGMELLKDAGEYQRRFASNVSQINAYLNIIATAVGDSKKWDHNLDPQLDNLLHSAQIYDDPWFFVKHLTLRYGGVPYRLNRSLQMLLAVPDVLASRADFVTLSLSLKTTDDVPGVVKRIRALLDGQRPILDAWAKAIDAEKTRFVPESLLNQARASAAHLGGFSQVQQTPEVAAANLKFYLTQVDSWMTTAAPLAKADPDFVPLIANLKAAREQGLPDPVAQALRPIIEKLSTRDLPTTDALAALSVAMTKISPGMFGEADRFPTMIARMTLNAGQNELLRPAEAMGLAQALTNGPSPTWYPAPPNAGDALIMSHQVWETLRIYRADLATHRFDFNPQEGMDHEIILRERAISTKAELLRLTAANLDLALRDRLVGVMDRITKPGGATNDTALPGDLSSAIRAAGTKPVADLGQIAQPMVASLVATLRKTADEYDKHAQSATAEAALPMAEDGVMPNRMLLLDEAARLQVRVDGLESLYRAIKLAIIESRLMQPGPAADWSYFEPFHGAQLSMSMIISQANDVLRAHVELSSTPAKGAAKLPIAARNAQEVAERLRTTATLIEAAAQGKPVTYDYVKLMKDARAEGLLGALKEEYELVRAHTNPPDAASMAEADSKLSKSAMARIVRAEEAIAPLADAMQQLKTATTGKPADVIAALQGIQKALPSAADAPQIEALPLAIKEATSSPQNESVAKLPALGRRITAVTDAISSLSDSFRDQAKLPTISTTAQQNRRFTTRDLPNIWVIQGIIESFDRRWLYTMRDLELSLTRTMLEVAKGAGGGSADATDLKFQYGRMVEWRARNFANDRRRNQGLSLLAPDTGPSLKLPEHIAEEFLRARNLQSPEDFKPRVDAYYEELYRDLAK